MPRGTSLIDEARLQGRLWTPGVSATELWFDADALQTISVVSGGVGTWKDRSGKGRDATQSTGSLRPTLTEFGLNGRSVVAFSSNYMVLSGPSSYQSTFIVYKDTSTAGWVTPIGAAAVGGLTAFHGASNNAAIFSSYTSSDTRNGLNFANGASIGDGTSYARPANYQIFSFIAASALTNAIQSIGNDRGEAFSGREIAGGIAELVIFKDDVGLAGRQRMEGYLSHKWNIALPASHPFRNRPPLIGD